jgi:hypothetical protein
MRKAPLLILFHGLPEDELQAPVGNPTSVGHHGLYCRGASRVTLEIDTIRSSQ